MTATPIPSRHAPATEVVGALNQINATLRALKAILLENQRLYQATLDAKDKANDVY